MKLEWKTCLRAGITLLVLIACVLLLPKVGIFLGNLLSAVAPLLIGCAIAYLVNILMTAYEKIYFPKTRKKILIKSRRPVCLLLAYLTLAVVIVLVIALVIPQLIHCMMLLLDKVPGAIKALVGTLENLEIVSDDLINYLGSIEWQSKISQLIQMITSGVGDVLDIVIVTLTSVFSGLATALIAIIFSIYLLSSKEKIARQYGKLMGRYIKPRISDKINYVFSVMNTCFRRYIVGQCTEAVILGALCTLGMLLFRFPYATMIGALVAFTALIPVAGAYIGAFLGAFMILTVDPLKALLFLIFLVVLQQLEGNIIYPRVVGSSIGLPGIWVLAAVTVGGGMLGIFGMLLGVPLAATAYKLLREDVNRGKPSERKKKEPNNSESRMSGRKATEKK